MIITTKIVIALQARVGTSKTSVFVNRSAEKKKDAQKTAEIAKEKKSYLNLLLKILRRDLFKWRMLLRKIVQP